MDNETKEVIINRLHDHSSHCGHCGSKKCSHTGYRKLPDFLPLDTVLEAINLNEHFFKEET